MKFDIGSNVPKKPTYNTVTIPDNADAYKETVSMEIPHGKYQGKTLQYVKKVDDAYYCWMKKENMLWSWDLMQLKNQPKIESPVKKIKPFWSDRYGAWLIGIIITDKTQ